MNLANQIIDTLDTSDVDEVTAKIAVNVAPGVRLIARHNERFIELSEEAARVLFTYPKPLPLPEDTKPATPKSIAPKSRH